MENDGKTPIACTSCAKAKAKCDKKFPCARCSSKRRVCQPRTARRSGDSSSQPNQLTEESWDPSILESSNNPDTILRWSTAPITPTSLQSTSYPSLSSIIPNPVTGPNSKFSQPQTSIKRPRAKTSQEFLHSIFAQSPRDFDSNSSLERQPPTHMEIDGENDPLRDNEMLSMEGIDYPLNFNIASMPDFLLPGDELPGIENQANSKAHQTLENLGSTSRSPTRAYRLEARSQSDRTSSTSSCQSPVIATSKSGNSAPEHEAVFAAQEQWSYFQCNPPSGPGLCSKTASIFLEGLERALEGEDTWQQRDWQPQAADILYNRPGIRVDPFGSYAREKLVAVTQAILQKALDTHHIDSRSQRSAVSMENRGFITLPPPNVLEYFLQAYVRRCEPYYAYVPARSLKPNEVMQGGNTRASCVLLLLMIAQGAAATSTIEARSLSSGLTEACRISLSDLLEKDYDLVQNLMVLQCGLLCTNLAAWSGDKWHMEIAIGQQGIYISMLRSVGLLDFQHARPSREEWRANPATAWKKWKEQEGRTRLVVSWIFVDQEISLFLDQAPLLSLSCVRTTMPDSDQSWEANSSSEWLRLNGQTDDTPNKLRMSIRDLFRFFMDGELANPNAYLSSTQLRLLLHPLQSLVIHLQQFLSCFPDGNGNRKAPQAMTKAKTLVRLEEVQSLLGQWYSLASRCSRKMTQPDPAMFVSLIIYHLINLNTLCCLPEIERVTRHEAKMALPPSQPKLDGADDAEQVFFHCGQIFRLLRLVSEEVRPPWWPAAVYRAALAAWMTSMTKAKARSLLSSLGREAYQPFAIDGVTPEDPILLQYLRTGEGQPMLLKGDGTLASLEIPQNFLVHGVDLLSEKYTTRFQDVIRTKLNKLMERWEKWKV